MAFSESTSIITRLEPIAFRVASRRFDRTLCQAQITARAYYPEIDSKVLAFRTISQDEYLQIIGGAVAPRTLRERQPGPEVRNLRSKLPSMKG